MSRQPCLQLPCLGFPLLVNGSTLTFCLHHDVAKTAHLLVPGTCPCFLSRLLSIRANACHGFSNVGLRLQLDGSDFISKGRLHKLDLGSCLLRSGSHLGS